MPPIAVRLWSWCGAGVQESWCGDVRGADPIAVRDGGQPLHGGAEEPGERLRLRLAQLGELGGHVRHRAMMLAELLSPPGAGAGLGAGIRARGWGRRSPRQRSRPRTAPRPGRRPGHAAPPPGPPARTAAPGRRPGGGRTRRPRPGRPPRPGSAARWWPVVVGVLERAPAHVGDREQLGPAAPSPAGRAAGRAGFDHPVSEEVVQVPPDRGGGQVQPGAQAGRSDRAVLQDEPRDPGPGATLGPGLASASRGWAVSELGWTGQQETRHRPGCPVPYHPVP